MNLGTVEGQNYNNNCYYLCNSDLEKGEVCRYLYLNYDVQLLNALSMVLVKV